MQFENETMEIPIYQFATPSFVVSTKVKAGFWLLFFCFAKNLGIGPRGAAPMAAPMGHGGTRVNLPLCMRLYGMILKISEVYSFFTAEGVTAVLIIGTAVLGRYVK